MFYALAAAAAARTQHAQSLRASRARTANASGAASRTHATSVAATGASSTAHSCEEEEEHSTKRRGSVHEEGQDVSGRHRQGGRLQEAGARQAPRQVGDAGCRSNPQGVPRRWESAPSERLLYPTRPRGGTASHACCSRRDAHVCVSAQRRAALPPSVRAPLGLPASSNKRGEAQRGGAQRAQCQCWAWSCRGAPTCVHIITGVVCVRARTPAVVRHTWPVGRSARTVGLW